MVSITIVQNDDGKVDVVVDDGTGAGSEPKSFESVDEALAMATETLKAGEGMAAEGTPKEEGMEGPEGEAVEPATEDAGIPQEGEEEFQGMRPKKQPGWEKFMSMGK